MTSAPLFKILLDNLSTAVLLIDSELKVLYINPAAEDLFKSSASRMEGTHVHSLFINPERTKKALLRMLRAVQPFTQRQTELKLPDNEIITVDYTATPLTSPPSTLLIELQQMDRLMQINREEALLSAHSTSRNLIRGLAHEIKNPLGGIRGASQLLSHELGDESEMLEYTDIILLEVDRLCNLVDRLLGPNSPPKFKPVNIHEITEHVATLLKAETGKTVAIVRDYDPSLPEIPADKEQLIQAILNISRNALQALQESGQKNPKIIFRTRAQRNLTINKVHHKVLCNLEIIDNGPGVPEEYIDRIFFPMISSRAEGTGLGLPIAQAAISMHQGLIKYQRSNDQTCFSIFLPLDNTDHDN